MRRRIHAELPQNKPSNDINNKLQKLLCNKQARIEAASTGGATRVSGGARTAFTSAGPANFTRLCGGYQCQLNGMYRAMAFHKTCSPIQEAGKITAFEQTISDPDKRHSLILSCDHAFPTSRCWLARSQVAAVIESTRRQPSSQSVSQSVIRGLCFSPSRSAF